MIHNGDVMFAIHLELLYNILGCCFFFNLFTHKTPQEILGSLVLLGCGHVYQFVDQLGYMYFMLIYMFEYLLRRTEGCRNHIDLVQFNLSAPFD